MLEPKEKAQQLFDLMFKEINNKCMFDDLFRAKQCALIAVDELIEFEKSIVNQIENIAMLNGHKFKREELYYQSVKQEIEKL